MMKNTPDRRITNTPTTAASDAATATDSARAAAGAPAPELRRGRRRIRPGGQKPGVAE